MTKPISNYIFTIDLPVPRPFRWRILFTFVALYFFGNLAALPLLRATQTPIEPLWLWGALTLLTAVVLGVAMLLANRTGLGAPLLEGYISRETRLPWLRSGLALTTLLIAAGLPFSLGLNLNVDPATYPAGYQLVLASVKAGIVEELTYRFLVVSLLAWLGSRFSRLPDGRPTAPVYWGAIVLAGLIFGWAHVDAQLSNPDAPLWGLAVLMLLNSLLGIAFGWLLWKLGLEWAMLAHFAYDAVVSAGLLKIYLLANGLVWVTFLAVVGVVTWLAWRTIRHENHLVNC